MKQSSPVTLSHSVNSAMSWICRSTSCSLPGRGADAHDRLELVAETAGVDIQGVAADHAAFFQLAQAFGDARGR